MVEKPPMPAAASVLTGPAEMALTRMFFGPQICREVADRAFERRLGNAHDVVVRKHARAAEIGQRDDASAAPRLHQRRRAASQRDERVGTDVERELEALARRLHKGIGDVFAIGKCDAVDQKVEPAMILLNPGEDRVDFGVVLHVERQHERTWGERVGEFADMFFEPALVGEHEGSAGSAAACAIAQDSERLFATPTTRPILPDRSDIEGTRFARRLGRVAALVRRRPAASSRGAGAGRCAGAGPVLSLSVATEAAWDPACRCRRHLAGAPRRRPPWR